MDRLARPRTTFVALAGALLLIASCARVLGLDEVAEVERLAPDAGPPVSDATPAIERACAIAPYEAPFNPALPFFGLDEELRFGRTDEIVFTPAPLGLDVSVSPGSNEARGRYLRKALAGGACFELRLRVRMTTTPTIGGVFFAVLRFGSNASFVLGLRPDKTFVAGQQDNSLPEAPFTVLGTGKIVEGTTHEVRVLFDVGSVRVLLDGVLVPLEGRALTFDTATKLDLGVVYADLNAATKFVVQEARLLTSR
jgi:hypothetical protein